MQKLKINYLLWLYPIVVLLMQTLPFIVTFMSGLVFIFISIFKEKLRTIFLLFAFTIFGHLAWFYFDQFVAGFNFSSPISSTLGRFGLLAYLIPFALWAFFIPSKENFFRLGDARAIIYFPFIWQGKKETIWRFILIFTICLVIVFALTIKTKFSINLLISALLFSFVNASLEELLWRGLILTRIMDLVEQKYALVISSLAFGLYHISLGFPYLACIALAIGGYYFAGTSIISRGLLAPWIMHFLVNIFFVFSGLIF